MAMRGDTADAVARLDGCGAEAELIALAKDCLASDAEDRPRDAGVVARRVSAYLAGVLEPLRAAERQRAVAESRAIEERRRRKLQLGLAAALLALMILGGSGAAYDLHQRQARAAAVERVMSQAITLNDQARAHPDNLARWQVALAAIEQAGVVLGGGEARASARLEELRGEAQAGAEAAERDRMLLDRAVDIRSAKADDPDGATSDAAYADAFREAGLDLAVLTPAQAGARIKARTPAVAMAVAASLDDWAAVRRGSRGDMPGARRLTEMAQSADADPWRNDFRAALYAGDRSKRRAALQSLTKTARLDELGAVSLDLLGKSLDDAGDVGVADAVLRSAQRRYPGDVWVNYELARVLEKQSRRDDAIRYYTAARAVRPETAHELAHALEAKGEWDEAIAVFRDVVERRREDGRHLVCLGRLLKSRGQGAEAAVVLDRAEAAMRSRIRLRPDDPGSHHILGRALDNQGKLTEAIAEYREAIRLRPNLVEPHTNLGAALYGLGKLAEAIEEYREAIRLLPDAIPHTNLGDALQRQGKLAEAIAEYRQAIRLRPDYAEAHTNLGSALLAQGKPGEAIVEYRAIIRLRPDYAEAHYNLGSVLRDQEKVEEAIAEFRAAIRLRPDFAEAHCNLGEQLYRQGHFQRPFRVLKGCSTGIYD